MGEASFPVLVQNIALLLALVLIVDVISPRWPIAQRSLGQVLVGIVIGAIGITLMLTPWVQAPGLVFDTRSVLLGISGLFFGGIPTLVAMAITVAFRIYQGGSGALTGVSVILATGTIGILWRQARKRPSEIISWWEIYLFGVVIHLVMLALMFTLPLPTALQTLANISLPVLVIYPLGTTLIGALITNRMQREQTKESLRRSEIRLNVTQHLTKVGGWEWDVARKQMYWTEETYRIHGYSPADIPAGSPEHIEKSLICYDPEDRPVIWEAFQNCIQKGQAYNLEFPFTNQQGQRLWIRTIGEAVYEKGKVARVVGNIIDISDQKQAEEALRERETYIQTVLDNLPIGIAVNSVDPAVTFNYMNDNFPSFYRTTREKLADPDAFWSAVYQDAQIREEIKKKVLEDYASGDPERMFWEDVPITRQGAETTYITARNIPLPKDGLAISTVWDVTGRKRAEIGLKQKSLQQEKMAALGRELAATLDLEVIYQTAGRYLKEMIDCPNLGFTLFDVEQQRLQFVYFETNGAMVDPSSLPALQYDPSDSANTRWKAISTQSPKVDRNPSANVQAGLGTQVGNQNGARSAIYVPMVVDKQVIGLLDLYSYGENTYSEEDGEWLSVVANQVGLVIQNARLFSLTQQRVNELSILHNIDQIITSNVNSSTRFRGILEQIALRPYVDAADIFLYDDGGKRLTLTAWHGFHHPLSEAVQFNLGEGTVGSVALQARPLKVLDAAKAYPGFVRSALWEKEEFSAYLGLPLMLHGELKGVLEIFSRNPIPEEAAWLRFMDSLAQQVAIAVDNTALFQGLQKANTELLQAYDATIKGWSQAMDLRDRETEGHTERVTELCLQLAQAFKLSDEKLVYVRRGALLHDIGKLGVPDQILFKTGPLTEEEWIKMKKHPLFAYEMLASIDYLRPALAIPYCHHEKWDGTGYPRGLKGEQIPPEARIFALVDVWDALTSDRPYRPAWSQDAALEYIIQQRGKHFDPQVVDVFLGFMQPGNDAATDRGS